MFALGRLPTSTAEQCRFQCELGVTRHKTTSRFQVPIPRGLLRRLNGAYSAAKSSSSTS